FGNFETSPSGIILSGGPKSVNDADAPGFNPGILEAGVPVLGVCYGLQLLSHVDVPGSVDRGLRREFGRAELIVDNSDDLFKGTPSACNVWMSHGDHIHELPAGYEVIAHTKSVPVAAVRHRSKPIWGVQFHPEVVHTENGKGLLRNFVMEICGMKGTWTPESFIQSSIDRIREQVGNHKVVCGLSGGVDSTVTAVLIHKAIGDQLQCVFVDNGLLRKDEFKRVLEIFDNDLHLPVKGVDASELFLERLAGVTDPE